MTLTHVPRTRIKSLCSRAAFTDSQPADDRRFSATAESSRTANAAAMCDSQPALVYLITGGSGFLGKHLVRLLLEKEDKVTEIRVFDKCPDPRLNELSTGENCSFLPGAGCVRDRFNPLIAFKICRECIEYMSQI